LRFLHPGEVHGSERISSVTLPAQPTSLPLRRRGRRWAGLFPRADGCTQETTAVCSGSNGTALVCSGCSKCCLAADGGYQCCQEGLKCCTTSTGVPSCCAGDGTTGTVLQTVTVTTTVTSSTASRTIGKPSISVHKGYPSNRKLIRSDSRDIYPI